jgi:putative peptidoglycan lipid II flippase
MAARGDKEGIWHTLATYSRLILLATVPVTLLLAVCSEPIVRMLFERGAFTPADTRAVAAIQRNAVLQIPFAVLAALILRVISSVKANHLVMLGAAINLTATVVFDYELARHWGVSGIALARSAVSVVSLCYLFAILFRVLRRL